MREAGDEGWGMRGARDEGVRGAGDECWYEGGEEEQEMRDGGGEVGDEIWLPCLLMITQGTLKQSNN